MFSVEAKSIVEQEANNDEHQKEISKDKDEQHQENAKDKDEHQQELSDYLMSFTPVQLEALKQLFAISPSARQIALTAFAAEGATLGRSDSFDRLRSSFSTPTHENRRIDSCTNSSDNESAASSASQRVHHKDGPQILAGYLVKNYFSAETVWDYLYTRSNRINSKRLQKVLGQLKDKLTPAQRKTLKNNRKTLTQNLKKKINAARNYRRKLFKIKGKTLKAPYAHMIDLTNNSDDESDNQPEEECGKADKADKVKKEDEVDKAETAEPADETETEEENLMQPTEGESTNRRKELAKKFVDRMKSLRSSRKKLPAKESSKRKRANRTTATEKTKESSTTSNQESPAKSGSSNKRKRARRTTTKKPKESSTASNQETPVKSSWKQREITTCPTFKKGSRVMGMWKGPECTGDWYEGVVKSINKRKKTAHVVFDDGDCDKALEWTNMTVLDP